MIKENSITRSRASSNREKTPPPVRAGGLAPQPARKRQRVTAGRTVAYIILGLAALAYIIPFYSMLISAFKIDDALATAVPFVWFPKWDQLSFGGFARVFTEYKTFSTMESQIMVGIKNTLIVAVPVVVVGMAASSLSAFAFAKLDFPCKKLLFAVLLVSMMMPGIILLIPSYMIFDQLYLVNTFFPLIVPPMFGSAACVFFLRQFFYGIPNELIDAAKVDGLSFFGIYFRIMLPLSVPALLAQAILGFVAVYNDYLNPMIYLTEDFKYTLQVALQNFASANSTDLPAVLAGCVLAMLPCVAIYFAAQKYFVSGIAMSGLKG